MLAVHHQSQHGKERAPQWTEPLAKPYPTLYRVSFSRSSGSIICLVEGCKVREIMRTNLSINFVHHHVRDKIVIL